MSDKTILEQWREIAYNQQADRNQLQRFWANYFNIEKGIYEQLLSNPDEVVSGTVKELAEKYGQDVLTMVGFLDGINDSLKIRTRLRLWMRIQKSHLHLTKNFFTRIWLMQRQTGCISFHSGMKSSQKKNVKNSTKSRKNPVQL